VQALPSLQLSGVPAAQTPARHASAPLQTLPSTHDVPLSTGLFAQPKAGSQLSVVHTFASSQARAVPAVQLPPWQVSVPLQTLPSLQAVPLSTGRFVQPVTGSQLSAVQTLASLQLSGVPVVQVPAWHVSAPLQTLPSVQDEPFATGVLEHPKTGSHESVVQTFESLQLSAVPPVQEPLWQVSAPLQMLPSGHAVPLSTGALLQPVTALQVSFVQTFESLQLSAVPPVQEPLWQVSSPLQTLLSVHVEPFGRGVLAQPVSALQLSVVQTLLSLQLSGEPAVQVPAWQVSSPLQTVPSAHGLPLATGFVKHPMIGSQLSVVQTLPSLQFSGVPAVQEPL
jgi:hypothetical protein